MTKEEYLDTIYEKARKQYTSPITTSTSKKKITDTINIQINSSQYFLNKAKSVYVDELDYYVEVYELNFLATKYSKTYSTPTALKTASIGSA